MASRFVVSLVLLSLACSGHRGPTPGPVAEESAPSLRLPQGARPTRYDIRLDIDPGRDTFTGEAVVSLELAADVETIWLNAEGLTIDEAWEESSAVRRVVTASAQEHDFLAVRGPFRAGAVRLRFRYSGSIDSVNTSGIFRQKDGDEWYVFTQFEDIDARRAFPCFDEPEYKVPWKLTLAVPKGSIALANTRALEERIEGEQRIVEFELSKPLPSYLVAFAVGPFDLVDAGTTRSGVPVRIAVPRERASEASWARETTVELVSGLEDYFGMAYPFDKLDQVAVPTTVGFSAMEHPGLITYTQGLILARPDELTIDHRRAWVWTAVHELAHQWFGNLVTARWWDDIWLNEAFATWAESVIIETWRPAWRASRDGLDARARAMDLDSLASARRIRQPIDHKDDIGSAFDAITYQKGSRIIRMFEVYLGGERFRAGIQSYLKRFAWSVATSEDFLRALDEGANAKVQGAFESFLTQVGTPLVKVQIRCEAGPQLELRQTRYRPLGSEAEAERAWQFPVCFRYPSGTRGPVCHFLTTASESIDLEGRCPGWVLPNPGGDGYYRWHLDDPGALERLVSQVLPGLSGLEQVAFADDLRAQLEAGQVSPAQVVRAVRVLASSGDRTVVSAAADLLSSMAAGLGDDQRAGYAALVREVFGARARSLGWSARANESEDETLLRAQLLTLVALEGDDAELGREAATLARSWLAGTASLAPDAIEPVLAAAARHGDRDLLALLFREAKKATTSNARVRLIEALMAGRDPIVVTWMVDAVLAKEIDVRYALRPMRSTGAANPHLRAALWERARKEFEALVAVLPRYSGASLAQLGTAQCDPADRQAIREFLIPRIEKLPGGPQSLPEDLEAMDLCIAQRQALRGVDFRRL